MIGLLERMELCAGGLALERLFRVVQILAVLARLNAKSITGELESRGLRPGCVRCILFWLFTKWWTKRQTTLDVNEKCATQITKYKNVKCLVRWNEMYGGSVVLGLRWDAYIALAPFVTCVKFQILSYQKFKWSNLNRSSKTLRFKNIVMEMKKCTVRHRSMAADRIKFFRLREGLISSVLEHLDRFLLLFVITICMFYKIYDVCDAMVSVIELRNWTFAIFKKNVSKLWKEIEN